MVLAAAVPAATILFLLAVVLVVSFRTSLVDAAPTLRHYRDLWEPFTARVIVNTLGFALCTALVAFLFGVPMAWLVERTDLPGKTVVYAAMAVGILVPGYFTAIGWTFLLHPRIGVLNRWAMDHLHLEQPPLNVLSVPGMGWIQGLGLAGLVFVLMAASFRSLDFSLEEAALMSGAGLPRTLARVTLPLTLPSLLAAGIFVLVIAISAFDVPLIIGLGNQIYVFSTYLYAKTNPVGGLPDYGLTAAFAAVMLVLAVALGTLYARVLTGARRYEVVTGKGYRPRPYPLGRWKLAAWAFVGAWLLLALGLPLCLMLWASFQPYVRVPSPEALSTLTLDNYASIDPDVLSRGAVNSVLLTLGAPTLAVLMSIAFSWVVLRSRSRLRFVFDYLAFLPQAVPSVIFGFAFLTATLFVFPFNVDALHLYRTTLALVVVMGLIQVAFATRVTNSAVIQISRELEEAGQVSGAGTAEVLRRIVLPLIRPALAFAWIWLAVLTFRELTIPTLLFSPANETLSEIVWQDWSRGLIPQASATTVLVVAILLPLVVAYWRVAGGRLRV
jgi:iron(III) transport system permease protein